MYTLDKGMLPKWKFFPTANSESDTEQVTQHLSMSTFFNFFNIFDTKGLIEEDEGQNLLPKLEAVLDGRVKLGTKFENIDTNLDMNSIPDNVIDGIIMLMNPGGGYDLLKDIYKLAHNRRIPCYVIATKLDMLDDIDFYRHHSDQVINIASKSPKFKIIEKHSAKFFSADTFVSIVFNYGDVKSRHFNNEKSMLLFLLRVLHDIKPAKSDCSFSPFKDESVITLISRKKEKKIEEKSLEKKNKLSKEENN